MEASRNIVIEGIEKVIELDLNKHKALITQTKAELDTYNQGVKQLCRRKKHYLGLVGKGKFNDDSLRTSIDGINVDVQAMSNKAKLAREKLKHHTEIVDTLTLQLGDQKEGLKVLKKYREDNGISN